MLYPFDNLIFPDLFPVQDFFRLIPNFRMDCSKNNKIKTSLKIESINQLSFVESELVADPPKSSVDILCIPSVRRLAKMHQVS